MHAYDFANTVVFSEPVSVDLHLASLGLTQADLISALKKGLSGRYSTTPNHPATMRGQYFYGEGVSGLREALVLKGFKKLSPRNVEFTVNDEIAIYFCRGCEQTGLAAGKPESRLKKGDFTREIMGLIRSNNPNQAPLPFESPQMDLGLDCSDDGSISLLPNDLGLDLWFLLYELYKTGDDGQMGIRAELSRPVSYNDKGIINGFSTRLILNIENPETSIRSNEETEFTADIDIDILKTG